tara:strand:+ start:5858 stop:6331 length:474 start_codon:yes stop_codon:yes gene_type:complete
MSNHLKTWGARINDPQANIGERKAEEYYESKGFEIFRFGFDLLQEDIDVAKWCKIPLLIRKKPDYIVVKKGAYFVEAKGCINVIRLKKEDFNAYGWWQDNLKMSLGFFFYSTSFKRHLNVSYNQVLNYLPQCEIERFIDNGKEYYKIYFESLERFIK